MTPAQVRELLNQEAFHQGLRTVEIPADELWSAEAPEGEIRATLLRFHKQLASWELEADYDANRRILTVRQRLRTRPPNMQWLRDGLYWSSQVTTLAVQLIAPIWAGYALDRRWHTSWCLWGGLVLGVLVFLVQLIRLARTRRAD